MNLSRIKTYVVGRNLFQTNITSLGTLTALTVDDITIDGSTISDSGDFTIDGGGDIILDVDDDSIILKDGGTTVCQESKTLCFRFSNPNRFNVNNRILLLVVQMSHLQEQ